MIEVLLVTPPLYHYSGTKRGRQFTSSLYINDMIIIYLYLGGKRRRESSSEDSDVGDLERQSFSKGQLYVY